MRKLIVKQLDYDLTPVAGLALVGHYVQSLSAPFKRMDGAQPVRSGVTHSDIVRSYLGQLVQGKSDFDAIENSEATRFSSKRWASRCCPRARRCASAWTPRRASCSSSLRR